jgi:hypothetical protein
MTAASYQACSIKRDRRTKAEVQAIRDSITAILKADHPQTVRQVFYQLVTRSGIEKSEAEYQTTVIRLLSEMRLDGRVRWDWIVDESRRTRTTRTFDNISDALQHTAQYYRRSALRECDDYIEIWSEKEALSGIIWEAAGDYDVPVVVSKGMPSLTQVYGSFRSIYRAAEMNAARKGSCGIAYGCITNGVARERNRGLSMNATAFLEPSRGWQKVSLGGLGNGGAGRTQKLVASVCPIKMSLKPGTHLRHQSKRQRRQGVVRAGTAPPWVPRPEVIETESSVKVSTTPANSDLRRF